MLPALADPGTMCKAEGQEAQRVSSRHVIVHVSCAALPSPTPPLKYKYTCRVTLWGITGADRFFSTWENPMPGVRRMRRRAKLGGSERRQRRPQLPLARHPCHLSRAPVWGEAGVLGDGTMEAWGVWSEDRDTEMIRTNQWFPRLRC